MIDVCLVDEMPCCMLRCVLGFVMSMIRCMVRVWDE